MATRIATTMAAWGLVVMATAAVAQDAPPPKPTSTGAGYVEYTLAASAPKQTHPPRFGVVMLGGHGDVDEATQFFCEHSGGGKIVILRASGDDDYNQEFHEKCPANSTTTIVFSSREASEQPWVLQQLRDAHAIFIAGGDQSNYIKFWKGTSVNKEMNAAIASGVPIAGISAGLAVEGQFIFASMIDTVTSDQALANPYFKLQPPRTAGREQFGHEYAAKFLANCQRHSLHPEDALATATALTAETIARSYKNYIRGKMKGRGVDYIVSGGGARNATLMAMLAQRLEPLGCDLAASEDFGLPAEAKEAAAFALLAWQSWHHLPGNLPKATGASRPAILGQVTYA